MTPHIEALCSSSLSNYLCDKLSSCQTSHNSNMLTLSLPKSVCCLLTGWGQGLSGSSGHAESLSGSVPWWHKELKGPVAGRTVDPWVHTWVQEQVLFLVLDPTPPPGSPAAPVADMGAQTVCLLFWTGKQGTSLNHLFSPKRGRCHLPLCQINWNKSGELEGGVVTG